MERKLDGKSTGSLVSTRNETVEDGKGRKYYRTALRPTTEVLDASTRACLSPQLAVAMLALSYNASIGIVIDTTLHPRFRILQYRVIAIQLRAGAIAQAETTSFPPSAFATSEFHPCANGSGTPNALLASRSRRRRRGGYFVSRDDASYNLSV